MEGGFRIRVGRWPDTTSSHKRKDGRDDQRRNRKRTAAWRAETGEESRWPREDLTRKRKCYSAICRFLVDQARFQDLPLPAVWGKMGGKIGAGMEKGR